MSEGKATMSISRYAKEIGVSPQAVYKAIDEGHLKKALEKAPNGYIRINYEIAEQEWVRTKKPAIPPDQDPAFALDEDETENDTPLPDGVPHLHASKASREHWLAQTAQLEYEKARGKYLDREEVRRSTFALARKTRDALKTIPERTAAILASMTNEREILNLLHKEIDLVCLELSRAISTPVVLVAKAEDVRLDDI